VDPPKRERKRHVNYAENDYYRHPPPPIFSLPAGLWLLIAQVISGVELIPSSNFWGTWARGVLGQAKGFFSIHWQKDISHSLQCPIGSTSR